MRCWTVGRRGEENEVVGMRCWKRWVGGLGSFLPSRALCCTAVCIRRKSCVGLGGWVGGWVGE